VSTQHTESSVTVHDFDEHTSVRSVTDPDGTFSVVANDLCRARGTSDSAIYKRLSASMRAIRVISTGGGPQRVCVVFEEGFRRMLRSVPGDLRLRERTFRVDEWASDLFLPLFKGSGSVGRSSDVPSDPLPASPPYYRTEVRDFHGVPVRTFEDARGDLWFIGIDACRALELVNSNDALSRLDPDEKTLVTTEGESSGASRQFVAINEPGLNQLLMSSRVEKARQFRRWLAHEVVPTLRKTASYSISPSASDPLTTALEAALENRRRQLQLEQDVRRVQEDQKQLAVIAERSELAARQAEEKADFALDVITEKAKAHPLVTWAKTKGVLLPYPHDCNEGKRVAAMCRSRGVRVGKLTTIKFPDGVNVYPIEILEEWLEEYRKRPGREDQTTLFSSDSNGDHR
jgi:prophage antirepressor-like protein